MSETIRIATRNSPLALWQAEFVKAELEKHHAELTVELVPMTTKGDKVLEVALNKVGGKGLFVKELEVAIQAGEADIAVHSMKDVPMVLPKGFELPVICSREEPTDAFVSNDVERLEDLPQGAIVGTSSLRRQSQLLAARPDLDIRFLRGNVGTRLKKLDEGEFQAIILASAGLIRLALSERIRHTIDTDLSLPAVGQGAVGIETRAGDERIKTLLAPLNDAVTTIRVVAERAMNRHLNGGCHVPIAGFATLSENELSMEGRVGSVDGKQLLKETQKVTLVGAFGEQLKQAESLGIAIAKALLGKGAGDLLAAL